MTTLPTTTTLTFPHPELTPIQGEPTNKSLRLLSKQLYANARAIPSHRGGGQYGHLALIMPDAEYLALPGAVAFVEPPVPPVQPVIPAGATAAQITEANRQHAAECSERDKFVTVREQLKTQLLAAVDSRYLNVLEDETMGYANVAARTMLQHLKDTYGIITPEEIEENREGLAAKWNPDDPIEDIWTRLKEARRFASDAGEPISDSTAVRLLLKVFEDTGVFGRGVESWRERPEAEHTLDNFKSHFIRANRERLRQLTTKQAGYHGANSAIASTTDQPTVSSLSNDEANSATTTSSQVVYVGNVRMYYCWTHGLGMNPSHTSATCNNKAEGHVDNATVDNMQNGCNLINVGKGKPKGKKGRRSSTKN